MSGVFLSAEWRRLIMANYIIDPEILKPFLPAQTGLDLWEGNCYVSLVGFLFDKVKLKGVPIPFHTSFEEVNLRFYVKHFDGRQWQRGVVFISEIVPLPAISMVANMVYGEKYSTMPVDHVWEVGKHTQKIRYDWKKRKQSFYIEATASTLPRDMLAGSKEHFIFEHYYGFTRRRNGNTGVYRVDHPSWKTYDIIDYKIHADFKELYGPAFAGLNKQQPDSVFLAEGSPVKILPGRNIVK